MLSISFGIPEIVNRESILAINELAQADDLGKLKKGHMPAIIGKF
jgi:hypothetical protein